MNHPAKEWVAKAEGDYASAQRESRARKNPNYDAACFHAQQCVEKYLKAALEAQHIPFSKTHDLALLLDGCREAHPEWEIWRPALEMLTQYAVTFRYPGERVTKTEARQAIEAAGELRDVARRALRSRRV